MATTTLSTSSSVPAGAAGRRTRSSDDALWPLLKETAGDWMQDNAMRLSAALALYTILSLAPLLVITMKIVSPLLRGLARYIAGDAKWLALGIDLLVSFGVVTLLFAAIFKFLPDVKLVWEHVWLGAVITAALFTVGKYGLSLYFSFAAPTS